MGTFSLTNAKILMGGLDLSGFHNSLTVDHGAEMLDNTRFGGSGTRSFQPGLKTVGLDTNGFWDSTTDEALFNRIQAIREVFSFAAVGEAEGDIGYTVGMINGNYNPGGEVGALLAYNFTGQSGNGFPLVRGRVLAVGSKAADGNGAGVQITAVGATQKMYAGLHVLSVGTSVDVVIESSADNTFAAPTTRLTFDSMTDIGGQWQEDVGPVTDAYWRAKWTVVGGAADIYVVFGIL
jgi:hypothetical protein